MESNFQAKALLFMGEVAELERNDINDCYKFRAYCVPRTVHSLFYYIIYYL